MVKRKFFLLFLPTIFMPLPPQNYTDPELTRKDAIHCRELENGISFYGCQEKVGCLDVAVCWRALWIFVFCTGPAFLSLRKKVRLLPRHR